MQLKTKQVHNGSDKTQLVGVDVLAGLGLSTRQAQVYLALHKSGGGRARVVSGLTGISSQDIYRLFGELSELGLVRQSLTVPVSYMAMPIVEAARLLLGRKTDELITSTKEITRLAERLTQPPVHSMTVPEPCFGEVLKGALGRQYLYAIAGAEGCIEVVASWVRFRQLCFCFESELKEALGRGVRVRVAVEVPPRYRLPKWVSAVDKSFFELRTMSAAPVVAFAVFDGEQVSVAYEPTSRLAGGPDLWSRHTGLVGVCRGYFDALWAALR